MSAFGAQATSILTKIATCCLETVFLLITKLTLKLCS